MRSSMLVVRRGRREKEAIKAWKQEGSLVAGRNWKMWIMRESGLWRARVSKLANSEGIKVTRKDIVNMVKICAQLLDANGTTRDARPCLCYLRCDN